MPETLESLLTKKAALDSLLGNIERGALIFAIVVGIGVVGEAIYSFRAWWNNRKLHTIQESIDQLRQAEIAELNRDTAAAQLQTEELRKRLAWRRITAEQHDKFVPILKPYAGSVVLLEDVGQGDEEAKAFSTEVRKLLSDAHWSVASTVGTMMPVPRGLICVVDESSAAGRALSGVLRQLPTVTFEALGVSMVRATIPAGASAVISVGVRPPP